LTSAFSVNEYILLEKQTETWPKVIIKDPTYHPQPKRGFRAAQMGQNMTQNRSKNSLKQPPQKRKKKRSTFSSFHQCGNPTYHNMRFHTVFGCFLQSQSLAGFSFFINHPLFDKITCEDSFEK
jgi:hypothetical protein